MATKVEMKMKLPVKFVKKEEWYVASCPVLDVFSQGRTQKKAKDNLHEAISLFLITCLEHGTLDDVLKNCGFRLAKRARPRKALAQNEKYLNIPIPFLVESGGQKHCHASHL